MKFISQIIKENKYKQFEAHFNGDSNLTNSAFCSWLTSRGNQHGMRRRFDKAIQEYKEALEYNHRHYSTIVSLGLALVEKKRFDEAIDLLDDVSDNELSEYCVEIGMGNLGILMLQCNLNFALCGALIGRGEIDEGVKKGHKSLSFNQLVEDELYSLLLAGDIDRRIYNTQERNREGIKKLTESLISPK